MKGWLYVVLGLVFLGLIVVGATSLTSTPPQEEPGSVTVMFVGDMLFDRTVRTAVDRDGFPHLFSCVADTLAGADITVGNLEGPITALPSVSVGTEPGSPNNFRFTFPEETAERIAPYFDIVSLGNNHALDWGFDGLRQTIEHLTKAGVAYIGDGGQHTQVFRKVHGVPLAFISYNEFDVIGHVAAAQKTIEQVTAAKQQGYIPVVYTHWGDEYVPPADRIRERGYAFIDAGAEIVIGSHPHVVLEHEYRNGRAIYYSLGNFIFDQFFSPEVQQGLMLSVTFTKDGVETIQEVPVTIGRDKRPCPSV